MMRTILFTLGLCLCVPLCSLSAQAQPAEAPLSDAKELARADELYKQANTAFNAKDYKKARELYLEAYAIKKTYDIAGHLGLSEMELGLYRDAAEHLAAALRGAPPHQGKKPFEAVIAELEKAKKEVGTVTIKAPAGAALSVDGKPIGTAPLAHEIFVEPGSRTFGGETESEIGSEAREISRGDAFTLELKLSAKPKGTEPVKPGVAARPSWPGWLMGGVGLAAAGVGVGLIGVGQGSVSELTTLGEQINAGNGGCAPPAGTGSERCGEMESLLDDANALTAAGGVIAGVGGALIVTGIVYLVLPDEVATAEVARHVVLPWVEPDRIGISLKGEF